MNLNDLRKQIDTIDNQLLKLLSQRLKMVKKTSKIKQKLNIPSTDKNRENEIFNKLLKKSQQLNISYVFIQKLFKIIINESKRNQKSLMI